eukprot:GHVU01102277.1.p1 GENE.GHVU01102277.1~~GHVU01102277.1.p1  ORF type:complete len:135 (-),score=18.60 GHVU01102277.1:807-1211(-)
MHPDDIAHNRLACLATAGQMMRGGMRRRVVVTHYTLQLRLPPSPYCCRIATLDATNILRCIVVWCGAAAAAAAAAAAVDSLLDGGERLSNRNDSCCLAGSVVVVSAASGKFVITCIWAEISCRVILSATLMVTA